jgi:5-methylcytosine-specific restriction endonuclease McrA
MPRVLTEEQRIKQREYQKQWERDNRAKRAIKDKNYYLANKEKRLANAKAWREANPDRVVEWRAKYVAENKSLLVKKRMQYREKNQERDKQARIKYLASEKGMEAILRKSHVRRARKNQNDGKLSRGIVKKLMSLQRNLCVACKCCLIKNKPHLDHIIALSKGGLNIDTNVQLLCATCNIKKRAKHPIDFMQENGYLL